MTVKTKKYRLSPSTYIRIALLNVLRQQWWLWSLLIVATGVVFLLGYRYWALIPAGLLLLYFLFWWVQFFGLTRIQDNKLMFERLFYELSKERVIIFLTTKQGMPIEWKQITSAKHGKDYFLLFISKAQFIYLPYSVFQSEQHINLVDMLLKNKKLI